MTSEEIEEQSRRIAAELRAEIARQDLSNRTIAERAGMQEMTLSRYLRGVRPFPVTQLLEVCRALDVPINDILTRAIEG